MHLEDPRPPDISGRQQPNVQLNVRISPQHRQRLDELLRAHPRRRASLGEILEELIDTAYNHLNPDETRL